MLLHFLQNVNNRNTRKWLIRAVLIVLLLVSLAFFAVFLNNSTILPTQHTSEKVVPSNEIETSSEEKMSSFPEIASSSSDTVMDTDTVPKGVEEPPAPKAPGLAFPTPPTPTSLEVGVFAGTIPELYAFEHRMDEQVDIAATAVHWGNERDFPEAYANLVTPRGTTLLIYWYPMDYRKGAKGQSEFHFSEILAGEWDEYIDSFTQAAARNGGDIIIAPFEEVNGSWTYWNGDSGTYGTKEEYIETFRYLRDKFKNTPSVRFAWIVNQVSVPDTAENAISAYYPGDAYVDVIGINAFNFGAPWLSFDTLVARAVGEVLPYHKPIYITSTASAPGEEKAEWIQDMFASTYFKNDTLKGFIWFNENKERDWSVWSDVSSEEAFKDAL